MKEEQGGRFSMYFEKHSSSDENEGNKKIDNKLKSQKQHISLKKKRYPEESPAIEMSETK